ncbi:hypothetical protein GW7_21502 [Heterocephalus glaber]|uniref:Snake toxin/toxin-like domain-containing protein n=1 Tax=Heterocephalus glaber TaxID=10181 RepID=G5AWD9_HETGA|nr:hypothetical protein GW7_21502 [Heterocephalus glaber]
MRTPLLWLPLLLLVWPGPPGQETIFIKSCAYTCPGFQESLLYSKASCCNTDLCNSVVNHRVSWGVLVFSLWAAHLSR